MGRRPQALHDGRGPALRAPRPARPDLTGHLGTLPEHRPAFRTALRGHHPAHHVDGALGAPAGPLPAARGEGPAGRASVAS